MLVEPAHCRIACFGCHNMVLTYSCYAACFTLVWSQKVFSNFAGSGAGGFGGGGGGSYGAAAGGGYGAQQAYAQPAYGGFGQQVCLCLILIASQLATHWPSTCTFFRCSAVGMCLRKTQ